MKKILILGGISDMADDRQPEVAEYAQQALKQRNREVETRCCYFDEIGYVVSKDSRQMVSMKDGCDLAKYDLVWFRGKVANYRNEASLVAEYLAQNKAAFINTAYQGKRAVGKIAQMYQLAALGFPIPPTVYASNEYLPTLIEKHLEYPVVVKDIHGSHGNNNYLVKDRPQLEVILYDNPGVSFMAQAFIANDCDYRLLVVGDETLIIKRQASGGSHLNNTSQGGTASRVAAADFPADIVVQARKYAAYCGYEIAGVDAIIESGTGQHYFLEINSQPQLLDGALLPEKKELIGRYLDRLLG